MRLRYVGFRGLEGGFRIFRAWGLGFRVYCMRFRAFRV